MKKKSSPSAAIEISSLIDIIFILLIFFVVTTTFQKSTINVNLPETNTSTVIEQKNTLDIYIDKKGQCYINNSPYTYKMIKSYLKSNKNKSNDVIIYPDKNTLTQHLISLMEILKLSNIDSMAIATEKNK
jgi:biopolymer transport protein ExbD